MMANITPEHFGLPKNPFHNTAAENARFWAGMPDTKRRMENIIQSVLPSDIGSREAVIIYGEFGSGKTHAMRYFARKIQKDESGYAFFINKTRQSGKLSFASLFCSLINECGNDFFSDLAKKVSFAVNVARASETSETSQKTIISNLVDASDNDMVSYLCQSADNIDYTNFFDTDDDYVAVSKLASLISVMTSPIGNQTAPYPAAYLFFDEMEETLDAKPAQLFTFFSACRDLINKTKQHCAIFFAYTAGAAALETQVPEHIQERLTRKYIGLESFSDTSAKDFIREFLRDSRIDNYPAPHPFYPFSEEAVDLLLERTDELVPRNIIRNMMYVFERAIRNEDIKINKGISKDTAEKIFDDL